MEEQKEKSLMEKIRKLTQALAQWVRENEVTGEEYVIALERALASYIALTIKDGASVDDACEAFRKDMVDKVNEMRFVIAASTQRDQDTPSLRELAEATLREME